VFFAGAGNLFHMSPEGSDEEKYDWSGTKPFFTTLGKGRNPLLNDFFCYVFTRVVGSYAYVGRPFTDLQMLGPQPGVKFLNWITSKWPEIEVQEGENGVAVQSVEVVSPIFVAFLSYLIQVSVPINNLFIAI
jgi:hypothetical protein